MFSQTIKNVMEQSKLLVAAPETTVRQAAEMMSSRHVGAVLVVQDDRLLGIFTERDAVFRVLACRLDPDATQVSDVMTQSPKTISPEKTFGHAMLLMHENGFRHLPVIQDGKPVGIVSSRNALDPSLEEFIAEESRRKHLLGTR
jgi:CBS domain-containing protein